jgi:hypothetical protein
VKRFAVLLLALAPMVAAVAASGSSVTIHNGSSWAIHELYLSPSDDEAWGPDQLGSEVIASDGRYTLNGIPCDEYDVRLVDEDGDECVIGGVGLCAANDVWTINDEDLLECQFGE